MINLELAIKMAKEYGFEVNKVEEGKGGMFYIDENNKKINVNDLAFDNDINMNIRLSQNNQYKMYGRRESMYTFAA
jgi:hypothetical protein